MVFQWKGRSMPIFNRMLLILLAGFMVCPPSFGEEADTAEKLEKRFFPPEGMTDPEDGKFDLSVMLASAEGFLPVPILITEPAIGYGGGAAVLFFHDSIANKAERLKADVPGEKPKRLPPPSISGVAGMGTENGTWGAGAFHLGIWKKDTIRYLGAAGYASVNYDLYGITDQGIPVNVEGAALLQQIIHRLGKSDFFAGANYKLLAATAKADTPTPLPPPAGDGVEVTSGGASAILEYDTRDNIFTPNKGLNAKLEWTHFDEWLASENRFDLVQFNNRLWMPLTDSLVLGIRADGDFSSGDVPFYMLPYVSMRGIPAMRYQGDHVVTTEAELRWDFTPRWSVVGFAGTGWTAQGDLSEIGEDGSNPAGGFGFRYLIARLFNLRVGVDVGFSEEDAAIYLTTGYAWNM
jgi:hypothetical protein